MKKLVLVFLTAAILANCSLMRNIQVINPEKPYEPFRIKNLVYNKPLILKGPYLDKTINEQVYDVTSGFVRLHYDLWEKVNHSKSSAENATIIRLILEYGDDYTVEGDPAKTVHKNPWKVRAELVKFVESERKK